MNEHKGFKIGDQVIIRNGSTGVVVGFYKAAYPAFDFTHYIQVRTAHNTNNWFSTSLTLIEEEENMDKEMYIVYTHDHSSTSSTKKGAEVAVQELLETYTADQIYVYKGVEVEFTHGVVIREK